MTRGAGPVSSPLAWATLVRLTDQAAPDREVAIGLLFALVAYGSWGILPLFWRQLAAVDAVQLLAHRVVWAWVFFCGWSLATRQLGTARRALHKRGRLGIAALLLGANWFVFVYAILTHRVLDASLGYFINPLVSVALGRFVLGERLSRPQLIAVSLAAIGIAVAAWFAGGLPWIAIVLAGTFGGYGLVRKTVDVPPVAGSAFETTLLLPIALAYLGWIHVQGDGVMGTLGTSTDLLLLATGLVTALPLLAFVNATRRLTLTTIGFMQYLAPSLQFALATWLLGEPLSPTRLLAFVCVWLGLLVFVIDAAARGRQRKPPEAP